MDRAVGFFVNLLGLFILAILDGFFAWAFLDSIFNLGFWAWVWISLVGIQIVKSGIISQEITSDLTRKRKRAKI